MTANVTTHSPTAQNQAAELNTSVKPTTQPEAQPTDTQHPDLTDQLTHTVSQQLENLLATLKSGDTQPLREYLGVMSRFHRYSLHNQILIYTQCPTATQVAGIKTWNQLGRRVKKGETSIRILAPVLKKRLVKDEEGETEREYLEGFKAAYIFDLSQTEGDELPNPPKTTRVQGELSQGQLAHYLSLCPYPVSFAPLQPSHYGYTNGKAIIINEHHQPADQLCTLLHEWTHAKYHFDPNQPRSKEGRELEAECTAYVLCQMLGLEARLSSAEYLLTYDLTPAQLMGALREVALGVKEIGQSIGV